MEDIMKYETIASMMAVEVRGRRIDVVLELPVSENEAQSEPDSQN